MAKNASVVALGPDDRIGDAEQPVVVVVVVVPCAGGAAAFSAGFSAGISAVGSLTPSL